MKCNCCKFETDNKKIMANHIRWNHKSPVGSTNYNNFVKKLKKRETTNNKITVILKCQKCGKNYELTLSKTDYDKGEYRKHCSRACANARKHTEESKLNISNKIKSYYKNKIKHYYCEICGKELNRKKKTCSTECYKQLRQNRSNRSEKQKYRSQCNFKFNIEDYKNEFDLNLVEQYGWYSPTDSKNPNLNGVSKDHMVSVNYGFEHNIDPKIISHPANCKLLKHTDNISKNKNCSITYEELLERIKLWDEKYGLRSVIGNTSVLQTEESGIVLRLVH